MRTSLFLAIMLIGLCISQPASTQGNWVFGNQAPAAYNYNPSGQTIKYYPPELGSGTGTRMYKTTPVFYQVPGRIEPNEQPNPLRDEMEKTDYV